MAEEKKTEKKATEAKATTQNASSRPLRKNTTKVRPKKRRDRRNRGGDNEKEFDQKIVHIRRVTRMYKGGRRMRLSVFVVVGDRKGRVGLGLGKGADVRSAQEKAYRQAVKNIVKINLKGNTIPHEVTFKHRASKLIMKPAAPGTGVVAGSSMRMVAEVAGIKDVLGKFLGTSNKISNAYATVEALKTLKTTRI